MRASTQTRVGGTTDETNRPTAFTGVIGHISKPNCTENEVLAGWCQPDKNSSILAKNVARLEQRYRLFQLLKP